MRNEGRLSIPELSPLAQAEYEAIRDEYDAWALRENALRRIPTHSKTSRVVAALAKQMLLAACIVADLQHGQMVVGFGDDPPPA